MENAVQIALQNNPRVLAAAASVRSSQFGIKSARSIANPELTVTPALTSPGGSDEELSLRQPLEINGMRSARTGIAKSEAGATLAESQLSLLDLVLEVKTRYLELARARNQLSLAKDILNFAEESHYLIQKQVDAGARPGIDATQTSIEVSHDRQGLTAAERQEHVAEALLNASLGRDSGTPVPELEPVTPENHMHNVDDLTLQALSLRPEIALESARRSLFTYQAKLSRAEGRPDLVPQLRADSITRGGLKNSGVGIGISIPIFDLGGRKARIRQAEESAKAQDALVLSAQNEIRSDVRQAVEQLNASYKILSEYQNGVLEQSKKLLESSRTGFQLGQTNIIVLLEAQRSYRSVQSGYIDAIVDSAVAEAELNRAVGSDLKRLTVYLECGKTK